MMKAEHMFDRPSEFEQLQSSHRSSRAQIRPVVIAKLVTMGLILVIASVIIVPAAAKLPHLAETGAEFEFVDHELKYAGGYGLVLDGPSTCERDFAFLDHEFKYGAGYGLRSASGIESDEDFAFVDHELERAGGYELRRATLVERGTRLTFLDHELAYAGGYGLAPAPLLAGRTADLACVMRQRAGAGAR